MIETDASDYTVGMRMTQLGTDGRPWLITFHSRKLVQAELNYNIHDKELLAIVIAFKTWRTYLEGAQHTVLVKTDHKNLTFFMTTKELMWRQARWAEILSQYDFRIVHCKGTENGQADMLSWWPDYKIKDKMVNPVILKTNEDGSISYNWQTLAAMIHIKDNTLEKKIIEEIRKDNMIQDMIKNSADNNKMSKDNKGIVYMHNLIYIPKSMRNKIITLHHNLPLHGHPGIEKTAEKIAQNYYFPNLRKMAQNYMKNCETCTRNKASRHQSYGKIQSPDTPEHP